MVTNKTEITYLTLNDRCDKCQAQAKHMYMITDSSSLMFCNHCNNILVDKLSTFNKLKTNVEGWNE